MADEKLIFPIGFDLEEGVKEASKEWKSTYQKQLQKAIDDKPLKVKIDFESKGIDTKEFKQWMALSREAEKLERERIKNAREWQKVADQAAMAETRRANATNESNARIERQNRKSEASERRKRDAVERTNEAYKRQGGYLQRLMQRMVAYASVAQAMSFLRNIREVTAQFELQRVALGSIIGDLNEANAMFEQIKAAAVKSPFQIKELVTYTKQLAAYKIESDELFETTQRLADISAGLGVGMERLVLAYGQIRATGYLRASEVRQLTEAGIPIVEELAKKMSELRGETVSAAEVMGLISERAISFGMVKEVFDDMTSAGGMFYKMQEKQAETLQGQWNNLKDSIAIMYEEIGNTDSVNNAIKGSIGLVKSLAENWQDVWSVVQSLSVAIGVYYAAMKNATVASKALTIAEATRLAIENKQMIIIPKWLAFFDRKNRLYKVSILLEKALMYAQIKTATATNVLSKSFWKLTTAMLSNPYTAVLAALAGITFAIVKFSTETKTTQERIDDLNKSVASLTDLKNDVKPLVDELDALSQKANKTAEEQKRLNQVTQELADKYPSTISAVREYGKEVDITAGKVRELYEAELKAKTVGLRAELSVNELALNNLRKRYDNIINTIDKGVYPASIATQGGRPVIYDKSYTQEELAQLWQDAKKVEEEMQPLEQSIHDAKVALGDIAPEATRAIKAFGSWKQTIKDFKTGLKNDLGEDIKLFDDDIINQFTSLNDALDKVTEQYNKNDEAVKRYTQTLTSKKLTQAERKDIEDKKARATAFRDTTSAILDYYNARSLPNKKKGGNEGKSQLSILQEELQLHEKIYAKYKEYRKYMNTEQAKAKVEDYFGDTIDALKFKPSFDKSGYQSVLEQYKKEANTLLAKAKDETEKASIKKFLLDIGFKIDDKNWEETKDEMEKKLKDLSDNLSRTKTAKEFFDRMLGMTGDKELSATLTMSVYGTTGDDLQKLMTKQVEEAFKDLPKGFDITKAMLGDGKFDYNLLESWIEKLPKDDRTLAQSIVDNWRKANADILTDLQKSYEDFMTYEERKTRVAEKYVAERKKIEESQYTKDERDKLLRASREAEKKELGAIAIEEFKASDDWIKSFEDLENLATPTIERLMTKLKEFITLNNEALTPEQLKSLMGEYDKLYNGLITRNPIQAITDSIKEYKTAMQGVKLAQDALDAAKAMGDDDLIAFAERGLTDAFDEAQKATSKLQKGLSGLGDKFSQAQQFVSSFADTLGVSEDTQFGSFLNGISDALGGVSKALAFAQLAVQLFDGSIKTMLASNPIGWILLAVSAIISAVQAIANARVKRIDQDIERIEDRLDSLSYAYDRLQKAQEKVFGSEYINNYQRQLENLESQQEAYLKQAELERSKGKKADEDKIREYEEQARDTADAIKDMYGSLSEHFLGQDLASAARDFANAWIDAYKEFSNTTDAMKAKFQDMIQNMVVESLLAKVMEKALEPVFTMIDEMGDGDFYSTRFWQDVMTTMQTATENGVVGAENVMSMLEQMGINLRGLGGEMTGISRDIATASEESILGLAAGINTQNFYISQVPTKLDTIIGLLRGDGAMPQGSAMTLQDVMIAQNQFLSHLPTIAQHTAETVAECKQIVVETRRTADALDRVIKPDGTRTTYKMNVVTTYQG